jgi:hypothetical protein
MHDEAAWSAPREGVQIRLSTDKHVYGDGEPIGLVISYRNVDPRPWALRMDMWEAPPRGQFQATPLYSLSRLTVTRLTEPVAEWALSPVDSNMFMGARLARLEPGAQQTAYGMLTTWAWRIRVEPQGASTPKERVDPFAHGQGPGRYALTGHFDPQHVMPIQVGDPVGADALKSLREFFLGNDTSLEAFWAARFMGISYVDALLLRDADYRLWSGALDTPPWELIVEP